MWSCFEVAKFRSRQIYLFCFHEIKFWLVKISNNLFLNPHEIRQRHSAIFFFWLFFTGHPLLKNYWVAIKLLIKGLKVCYQMNIFLTGTVPIIRCPKGNAAEMVAEVIQARHYNYTCSLTVWAGQFTFTVLISPLVDVYYNKWIPSNLMLGDNPAWTSILSWGVLKYLAIVTYATETRNVFSRYGPVRL